MNGQSKKLENQQPAASILVAHQADLLFVVARLDYTRSQLILRDASYHHAYILEFSGGYNEGYCCG